MKKVGVFLRHSVVTFVVLCFVIYEAGNFWDNTRN